MPALQILLLLAPLSQGASPGSVDGIWGSSSAGGTVIIALKERADGRLLGYIVGESGVWVRSGLVSGSAVTFTLGGEDGGGPISPGSFAGSLSSSGTKITGTLSEGSTSISLTLRKVKKNFREEPWVFFDSDTGSKTRFTRATKAGLFQMGGFVGLGNCDFLACGGVLSSWAEIGTSHLITTNSFGGCSITAFLSGNFDPASKFLAGTWTLTDCTSTSTGSFIGGKEGATTGIHILAVLDLVRDFADDFEAESSSISDTLHSNFLDNGTTRADFLSKMNTMFSGWNGIRVDVERINQIITIIESDVTPWLGMDPHLDWSFTVYGTPVTGGAEEVLLSLEGDSLDDSDLFFISPEKGRAVFIGNGQSDSFEMGMPLLSGMGSTSPNGIWPFGIHDTNHPGGHPGIDPDYKTGAKVLSSTDGTIVALDVSSSIATEWTILVQARPGVVVQYEHVMNVTTGLAVGSVVTEGQTLGDPSPGSGTNPGIHWGLITGWESRCPTDWLHSSGKANFDTLFATAAYHEELCEPLECNEMNISFPLTTGWDLTSGSLAARIEFARDSAADYDYDYVLYDSTGTITESGAANWSPIAGSDSQIDLTPSSGGATKLGLVDIIGATLQIDWDTTSRPTNLSGASVYTLDI